MNFFHRNLNLQIQLFTIANFKLIELAPVVRRVDSGIHWINHYPLDNSISFATVYPLDSDLSGG